MKAREVQQRSDRQWHTQRVGVITFAAVCIASGLYWTSSEDSESVQRDLQRDAPARRELDEKRLPQTTADVPPLTDNAPGLALNPRKRTTEPSWSDPIAQDFAVIPAPVLQTVRYWNGQFFSEIQMRIRETRGVVVPTVDYLGKNPIEHRRWEALARAAWFGALLLYEGEPTRQVEFVVDRTAADPNALAALLVATYAALHNRGWPSHVFFAGAITPDGRLIPPPRLSRIRTLAKRSDGELAPMGDIRRLVGQPSLKTSTTLGAASQYAPQREVNRLRAELASVFGKLTSSQPLELQLDGAWSSKQQRLEGRFAATELGDAADWFQLAIASAHIRLAGALAEFAAVRLEPLATRLRARSTQVELNHADPTLQWFLQLARVRLESVRDISSWVRKLPPEKHQGKRYTLRTQWLKDRVMYWREFALALRRSLVRRGRGQRHPLPYPMGELEALVREPTDSMSRSLPSDWGTWIQRGSLSWAHYVALITQQPKAASSTDPFSRLSTIAPHTLPRAIRQVEERTAHVLQQKKHAQLRIIDTLLERVTAPKGTHDTTYLKLLERAYYRFLYASEGARVLHHTLQNVDTESG